MRYSCRVGYLIEQAAEDMTRMAERHKEIVTTNFNGVKLTVRPGDTASQVVRSYREHDAKQ